MLYRNLLASVALLLSLASATRAADTPPNVIFLMADDLGYGDVGFNGNKFVETPHLDRMAKDGIRFTRFYSIGPICSPTRASVQTGRHYMRFGMMNVNVGKLPAQEISLPRIAKSKGYATGHFGKWHLGTMSREHTQVRGKRAAEGYGPPWERGYDTTFTTETNIATWDPLDYTGLRIPKHSCTFWSNGRQVPGDYKGSSERIIMDRAIEFVSESATAKKPFLATVWFYGPHSPVRAGAELRELYAELPLGKQHYYGAVTFIDTEVGRLRAALSELGVEHNTLIFFCSDNGPEGTGKPAAEYTPYHGAYHGSAGRFRGRKRSLYNGGVCVPAVAVWPDVVRPGQTITEPVCVLDYVPTLNEILAHKMPDARPLDGVSILPLLNGHKQWRRERMIPFATKLRQQSVALIHDGYKFYSNDWNKPSPSDELYHLADDHGEKHNLAAKNSDLLRRMKLEFIAWVDSCHNSYAGRDYPKPYTPQGSIIPRATRTSSTPTAN